MSKRGNSRINKKRPRKGSKGGRPAYKPTKADRALVLALMVNGVSVAQAARILSMDEKSVRKHFGVEIEHGREQANAKVASRLYEQASGPSEDSPSVTSRIFWLKARAGWKDGYAISNPDGTPLFGDVPGPKFAALAAAAAKTLQGATRAG
jgi:hypothetical protein